MVNRLATILIAAALVGCIDEPIQPRRVDSLVPLVTPKPRAFSTDSAFLEISKSVPGFSGFYFDSNGNLHALLKDLGYTSRAMARLAPLLAEFRGPRGLRGPIGRVIIHQAQFSIDDLLRWQGAAYNAMSNGMAYGIDIDEVSNRLVLYTDRNNAQEIIAWLTVRGVEREALRIKIQSRPIPVAALTDRIRPLLPGTQTGGSGLCTMGVTLKYDGVRAVLTNSHCTSQVFGGTGTVIYQNTAAGTNRIGVEIADPQTATHPNICPQGIPNCRYSDVAIVQLDDSVTWDAGKIAFTYSPSQDSTTNVIDSGAARQVVSGAGVVDWIGNTLYKTGKSSGTTYGTVTNSNYSYVHPLGGGLTLMMQSIVAADVRPGG